MQTITFLQFFLFLGLSSRHPSFACVKQCGLQKKQRQATPGLFHLSLFLLCFFGATAVAAQRIGARLGLGITSPAVTYQPNPYSELSAESNTGLVLGIFTQATLSSNWVLQPAVQLAFKGYMEKYASNFSPNSSRYSSPITITYLELPLDFIYAAGAKGNGFQLGAGPVGGVLLNRDAQLYALKAFDLGANVLAGYQTPIGFSVHLSYTHGFFNAAKGDAFLTKMKNRFTALTVGYLF